MRIFYVITFSLLVSSCTNINKPPSNAEALSQTKAQKTLTIVRDNYGIPHIYADDKYGLFYGYGYALGQDRLFQLEMAKRSTEGKVAEVLGEKYLESDKRVRRNFNPADVMLQIEALDETLRQPFEAYADGLNAWIKVVNREPKQYMPKEFGHYDFKPSDWNAYDVFMLFIGNVAHLFASENSELDNLAFLQQLIARHGEEKGWKIFDATMPLFDSGSQVTVPDVVDKDHVIDSPKEVPSYVSQLLVGTNRPVRQAYENDGKLLAIHDPRIRRAYLSRNLAKSGPAGYAGFHSASNIWLANQSKVKNATAVLVSGPQLGWGLPSYVHAVGLHGAGYDVVGKAFMFPFFISAYTNDIAWGTTYGASDQVDIFQLKLNPDNPEEYFYKGRYRAFEKRSEHIIVRDRASVAITAYQSVQGNVILRDLEKGVAYSAKRSWEGHEVKTAAIWADLPRVKDFKSFRKTLSPMSTTINFYYMDTFGNIGYTLSGKYPQRHPAHDNRLPAIGNGTMDWQGIQAFKDNPHAYNPEQGYISNWNNRPSYNWPSPDRWAGNWAKAGRVNEINERIESSESMTPEQFWEINAEVSYADLNIKYIFPYLQRALASERLNDQIKEMAELLENWDRRWVDSDEDGYYDTAAPAIMEAWLRELLLVVLQDDVGEEFFHRFASPGYPIDRLRGSWNSGVGIGIIVRNLEVKNSGKHYDFFNGQSANEIFKRSFESAYSRLVKTYGKDITLWKIKIPSLKFSLYNYHGVPQALPDTSISLKQMMNRGSEANLYIVKQGEISGQDGYAPGQSGFIAPNGNKSKHYTDQLELFGGFDFKILPLSSKQVGSMTEEKIKITY